MQLNRGLAHTLCIDDSDFDELFEQQEKTLRQLRDLRVRVDFAIDSLVVLQTFFAIHASDPDVLRAYKPDELLKLMTNKGKTLRQKMELLAAGRRRRPSSPPPSGGQN